METLLGLLLLTFFLALGLGAPDWIAESVWFVFLALLGIGALFYILNRFALFRRVRFADTELNKRFGWRFPRFWNRSRKYAVTRRPGAFSAGLVEWGLNLVIVALFPATFAIVIAGIYVETNWLSMAMILGAPAIGLALLFRLLTASQKARRHRKRLTAPDAENALQEDDRPPVLLLRSFRIDEANADQAIPGDIPITFEEFIVSPLTGYGPVIAIGRPTEELPPLGAHREYVAVDWQGRVNELLGLAQIIVVILDNTPGLQWELEQLRDLGLWGKILLVVQSDDLNDLGALGWGGIDMSLGSDEAATLTKREVLALVFGVAGKPYYIIGPRRNAEYYRDAIRLGSKYIRDAMLPT